MHHPELPDLDIPEENVVGTDPLLIAAIKNQKLVAHIIALEKYIEWLKQEKAPTGEPAEA